MLTILGREQRAEEVGSFGKGWSAAKGVLRAKVSNRQRTNTSQGHNAPKEIRLIEFLQVGPLCHENLGNI